MNQTFRSSDGLSIAYDRHGTGAPLICLSGLTRNRADFDYVLPFLTGVDVIRMDYRGRGASEWGDHASYTIPREAQDVLELMDHLNIDKAAVLGTSRGGLIAMTLAMTAKEKLTAVMLNDIGPEIKREGLEIIGSYVGRNPVQKTYEEAEQARAALFSDFGEVPKGRWMAEVRKHYVQTPDGLAINFDPTLRHAVLAAAKMPPIDLWPFFDALAGMPLAALRAANSNILSASTFEDMQKRNPDIIAVTVPERGHVPFLDEAESLEVIEQFLEHIR